MAQERNQQSIDREMHDRLHPNIFHPRYYHLKQLKKAIQFVIQKYFQSDTQQSCLPAGEPAYRTGRYEVLVDYGCGSMPYRTLFAPYVKQYVGADIALNKAAQIVLDEQGRLPLNDGYADVILSTQVLEHVTNPDLYLREACRVMKKHGLLILSTHGIWMYHPDPVDYWRWTSAGLQKIIQENGFEIIDIIGIQGLASVGLQLLQDAFLFRLPFFIKWFFVPVMQFRIAMADSFHTANHRKKDACVFMIVAKKR
ncbi:class I SAM-dependent methyltransferase [Thermoflavifilum thermophilum]|uniref:Methyltransferase domain-containing protein n=1 Tax=Thermoflavifilum thermophilum TaxID=1393122 RepID=A0A1I7MYV5_9BACT|nr:class I SAM-dependent methyltransferase [Thermoflavifilum thermophilum]SFV27525.1 Methyltransferase domain-containing protein [Thermoflavifilum thermophilum]